MFNHMKNVYSIGQPLKPRTQKMLWILSSRKAHEQFWKDMHACHTRGLASHSTHCVTNRTA
jgi:hypothetical protein